MQKNKLPFSQTKISNTSKFATLDSGKSIINLDNVTNVAFLDNQNRIVFNFNNNIETHTQKKGIQVIADYRYADYTNIEDYQVHKSYLLTTKFPLMNFIVSNFSNLQHHVVNPKHITFINTDVNKLRIIFNLSNSITKTIKDDVVLVNDFVFWDHNSIEDFETNLKLISSYFENN